MQHLSDFSTKERRNSTLEYDFLVKILLIGSSGVGKSCMLLRFVDSEFNNEHMVTVGVDFRVTTIKIQNFIVKIQIWDTAGQERFKSVTQAYYRSANGILLIFDTTNRKSFTDLDTWVEQIQTYAPKDACIVVVGNKADLVQNVSPKEALKFAQRLDTEYIQTSAQTGQNVSAAFLHCVHLILKNQFQSESHEPLSSSEVMGMIPHSLGYTDSVDRPLQPLEYEDHSVDIKQLLRLSREREIRRRRQEEEEDCCYI